MRRRDQRGLAAPLVVTLTGLLMVLTLLGGGLGRLLVDQRRVSSAADLAALAGAAALQRGGSPCAAAQRTGQRNGAEIVSCTVTGEHVVVRAAAESPGLSGVLGFTGRWSVEADARAGPVG
jgi:secretion/DNA translocation related TadE-like protein